MLPSSASLSCCFGMQEVGMSTPGLTHSAKAEHRLNAVHLLDVETHILTVELSLESAEYINEFENSNWPNLKHFCQAM